MRYIYIIAALLSFLPQQIFAQEKLKGRQDTLGYETDTTVNIKPVKRWEERCNSGNCEKGRGFKTYANGDSYAGEFQKGMRNGYGTYHFINGDTMQGFFLNDTIRMTVDYKYANGDRYIGPMKDLKPDGSGTFYFRDRTKYIGEMKNGQPSGKGTWYQAEGRIQRGQWNGNTLMKAEPFAWSNDTTGDALFCKDFRANMDEISNGFENLKTYSWNGEKGEMYMPEPVIQGAQYAYINRVDSNTTFVYYELLKGGSFTEAENVFTILVNKIKICKPYDWDVTKQDFFKDGEEITLFVMNNKLPKRTTRQRYTVEVRAIKVDNNSYNVSLRMINGIF